MPGDRDSGANFSRASAATMCSAMGFTAGPQ